MRKARRIVSAPPVFSAGDSIAVLLIPVVGGQVGDISLRLDHGSVKRICVSDLGLRLDCIEEGILIEAVAETRDNTWPSKLSVTASTPGGTERTFTLHRYFDSSEFPSFFFDPEFSFKATDRESEKIELVVRPGHEKTGVLAIQWDISDEGKTQEFSFVKVQP